jgi:PHS family inorganic phosphate transporter-like MFS transporter
MGLLISTGFSMEASLNYYQIELETTSRLFMNTTNATVSEALNDVPFNPTHIRTVLIVGMGFLTDAYNLFIITVAFVLAKPEFHPSALAAQWVSASALIAAFIGAILFGWIADCIGRNAIYRAEMLIIIVTTLASALSPNVIVLIVVRFILGIAIGGNYPVTAVLMSEYANTQDRGRLVGMVFSMQAVGLVIGPLIALPLLLTHLSTDLTWRLMLLMGMLPALAAFFLSRGLPESPRYLSRVKGQARLAAQQLQTYSKRRIMASTRDEGIVHAKLGSFLLVLIGTVGTWFVFDYAYYGNSLSTPLILSQVAPDASLITNTFWTLLIFLVAAVPGYVLAFNTVDRIGRKRLQLIGFLGMGLAFLLIGVFPGITQTVVPFLLVYSISYFFAEFGPNTTTFILAAELLPINKRATGHGIAAGVAKLGAFLGVFLFNFIIAQVGLKVALDITFVFSLLGCLLTLLLPEPAGKSLEEVSHEERALTLPASAPPLTNSPVAVP